MKTRLQEIRKERGFKSARDFAEHIGINVGTYTDYEQGRRSFSLERAWEFADALDCTLDELAGRAFPPSKTYADQMQEEMNGCYESMNAEGRKLAADSVKAMSSSPELRMSKDREISFDSAAMGA